MMKEKQSRGVFWKPNNEVLGSRGVSGSDTAAAQKCSGQLLFQIITLCCAY